MNFEIERGGSPPPSAGGRGSAGKYAGIADAAREKPGEWIHVVGINVNVASGVRRGETKGFQHSDEGWFEVTTRDIVKGQGPQTCTLWVRYHIGKKEEEEGA
jgi:hypothetical protein